MIKILKQKKELSFKEFIFPGGEIGIKLNSKDEIAVFPPVSGG